MLGVHFPGESSPEAHSCPFRVQTEAWCSGKGCQRLKELFFYWQNGKLLYVDMRGTRVIAQSHGAEHPSHSSCCCLAQSKSSVTDEKPSIWNAWRAVPDSRKWWLVLDSSSHKRKCFLSSSSSLYESWVYISLASCSRKVRWTAAATGAKAVASFPCVHVCILCSVQSVFRVCLFSVFLCCVCRALKRLSRAVAAVSLSCLLGCCFVS